MRKVFFTLIFINLIAFTVFAQNIGIYEWRDHLPYNKGLAIAEVGNEIFCATPFSLFSVDKTYNSLNTLNKVKGLSDVGINAIEYNAELKTLVVAYSNTNLDLVIDGSIFNISDIKRKPILGNKTINRICLVDNYAYLACGFGIVVVDIKKREIKDTYYIGPEGELINVLDITHDGTYLYAATEKGIFKAEFSNPFLSFYGSWTKLTSLPLPNAKYNAIRYFNGRLITNQANPLYNDDLMYISSNDQTTWSRFDETQTYNCYALNVSQDKLLISYEGNVDVRNADFSRQYLIYAPSQLSVNPSNAIVDSKTGAVWIADRKRGMLSVTNTGWTGTQYTPNGPHSANVFYMDMKGEKLWVAAGGRNGTWLSLYMTDGLYSYYDNTWTSFNRTNHPAFDSIVDIVCTVVDPTNHNKSYAGSWGKGLIEFTGNTLTNVYNKSNSSLEGFVPLPANVMISGLAFDSDNNLWVCNSGAASSFSKRAPNGEWTSYNLGGSASGQELGRIIVDTYGQKWALMRQDHSLLVFNEKNSFGKQYRILGSEVGNGAVVGNKVYSIAVDLDGAVWTGTDAGIGVFYNPGEILGGTGFDAQRILVEQDGYAQYLLENEVVKAIAVDGANRKWIGTDRAGVFLLSADGTKEIFHFTEDNSPLLSNSITDISIASDGEVFIGTSKGIVGFRGDAPSPGNDTASVMAFPNPVREGYEGPIAIKGLPANASVKITDISGNIVFNTRALGNQAVWNGKTYAGKKVKTGVYIVLVASDDGSETSVSKILVIN